ncbi:MAG: hypothetical protein FWD36_07965 [Treponema sp.]|nr:hypothetical protein [Treponema sp.]
MKKGILALVIAVMAMGIVFAQDYTVESVKGSVQREGGNGRVAVKAGDTLNADTVIHTAAGSSLVLKSGERTITIPAARNGKVSDLAAIGSGLRIGGNVARVETAAATRTGGQASTASARASDAASDEDIAAE